MYIFKGCKRTLKQYLEYHSIHVKQQRQKEASDSGPSSVPESPVKMKVEVLRAILKRLRTFTIIKLDQKGLELRNNFFRRSGIAWLLWSIAEPAFASINLEDVDPDVFEQQDID